MKSKEILSFKRLFKRRSEMAFVAILIIAALHFAFQFSFIRSENIENSRIGEFPVKVSEIPVKVYEAPEKIKQVQEQAMKTEPAEFKAKKPSNVKPAKNIEPVKQHQTKIAPSKPLPKKKIPVESRAARLRRAEKILTGI